MRSKYVHGYDQRENIRLQDQASTLVDLLHSDTLYPCRQQRSGGRLWCWGTNGHFGQKQPGSRYYIN